MFCGFYFPALYTLQYFIFPWVGPEDAEVLVALDAEKALGWVEQVFLFAALGKFGLHKNFMAWVKLLYQSPLASVSSVRRQGLFLFPPTSEYLAFSLCSLKIYVGILRWCVFICRRRSFICHKPQWFDSQSASSLKEHSELNLSKSRLFPIIMSEKSSSLVTVTIKQQPILYIWVQW